MRSQQTTDPPHNFTLCKDRSDEWGRIPECPIPQFAGGFPQVRLFLISKRSEAAQGEGSSSGAIFTTIINIIIINFIQNFLTKCFTRLN